MSGHVPAKQHFPDIPLSPHAEHQQIEGEEQGAPKNAHTANPIPERETPCRHSTHSADSASMNMKSRLNWPGHCIAAISAKKIVNKSMPWFATTTPVYADKITIMATSKLRKNIMASPSRHHGNHEFIDCAPANHYLTGNGTDCLVAPALLPMAGRKAPH